MNLVIVLGALAFLMLVAYRGYSVILLAPVAAMGAVLLTDPSQVAPVFTGLYMSKLAGFLQLYFPVMCLGALFGKVFELAGFSQAIAAVVTRYMGSERAMLSTVLVCALLTYGGISLFVVVFAVYPFAADLFRRADIPKRLIPGTIALGTFTFTMDCLPGSPQIQNIIPTTFFQTNLYAAPWLGVIGAAFILLTGMTYLNWQRRRASARGEGYGVHVLNEPEGTGDIGPVNVWLAVLPLVVVAVANKWLTIAIPQLYGESVSFSPTAIGNSAPVTQDVTKLAGIWAVQGALLLGTLLVFVLAWRPVTSRFMDGSRAAVGGALLASVNTASEYGFGAVIASLAGFRMIAEALRQVPDPLINEAVTVSALSGITGSASGGMSIALAAMSETFISSAQAAGIPLEVLHRVAAMASGGMDTLPHNGAVITLLTVTGLTHRQSYKDIFAITLLKTIAVFVVIAVYRLTGLV